jgi:hypothetical protein
MDHGGSGTCFQKPALDHIVNFYNSFTFTLFPNFKPKSHV